MLLHNPHQACVNSGTKQMWRNSPSYSKTWLIAAIFDQPAEFGDPELFQEGSSHTTVFEFAKLLLQSLVQKSTTHQKPLEVQNLIKNEDKKNF